MRSIEKEEKLKRRSGKSKRRSKKLKRKAGNWIYALKTGSFKMNVCVWNLSSYVTRSEFSLYSLLNFNRKMHGAKRDPSKQSN